VKLTLNVWRQESPDAAGRFETYRLDDISEDMSFLEMLDVLNQQLIEAGEEPVHFDHDCREGICGSCGLMINGTAHGPERSTATCQLHMRKFADGDTIDIEPWRASGFPVIKDLVVNRSAFPKETADDAFDAAACIGCGACVAACPNGAAQLFTSAKVAQLNMLPQGQAERYDRVVDMVDTMEQFFGSCTNIGECSAACPKDISLDYIAKMNRDYLKAKFVRR
jgi:succinate dehydrogenase / fumarate reductase, iron-sulfur subunit